MKLCYGDLAPMVSCHVMLCRTMMVFKGTSSPDSSSICVTVKCTLGLVSSSLLGRNVRFDGCVTSEIWRLAVLIFWGPLWSAIFDDIVVEKCRRAGRQAVMMPLEHSITRQVQYLPSFQDVFVVLRFSDVVNWYALAKTTLLWGMWLALFLNLANWG